MKGTPFAAIFGCGSALIMNSNATAAPQLAIVSLNTTNQFLVANGLMSAVVGVTGFAPGERLQGFIGNAEIPWTIQTHSPNGFFNVDSNPPYFDGQGQTAANAITAPPNGAWDTGVLPNATTSALGAITSGGASNPIGFAQYGLGYNTGSGADVSWLSSNPEGIQVQGTANLFRLTWPYTYCMSCQLVLVTNTAGQLNYHPVYITLGGGCVPTPGGMILFGIVVGIAKRRRRCDELVEAGSIK